MLQLFVYLEIKCVAFKFKMLYENFGAEVNTSVTLIRYIIISIITIDRLDCHLLCVETFFAMQTDETPPTASFVQRF